MAQELQKAELISYVRGRVHIIDIAKVRQRACECEAAVDSHHARIFDE